MRPLYYFAIGGYTFGYAVIFAFCSYMLGKDDKVPEVKEAALVIPLLIIGVFGSSAVGLLIAVYYQKSNDKASKRWMYGFLFAITTQLLYIIVVIFVGGQTYTIVLGKSTYT